ncbi:hypothetical protein ABKN59_011082 [Abortiporus biennis]
MTTVQKTSQICTLAKTRHMIPCLPSHSDMDVPFVHVVQKPLRSMAHEILQCKPKTLKLGTKFSFAIRPASVLDIQEKNPLRMIIPPSMWSGEIFF